jgi:predicted O-linked N-acetylglucosamine transferase (SPINDLY family)
VAFISADLVDHSTAHIVTAELIAMSKMQQQDLILWVVCVAKRERIDSMNPSCPYRTALKVSLGARFLEVGHLSLANMTAKLKRVHPHAILHAGFHQSDDQPQILDGSQDSIVIQTVAHAGPTGSNRVDFILASSTAIPTDNEAHFREKVRIDAPFLGNSFRAFFDRHHRRHAVQLHQVRTIHGVRSQVREALGLPTERKLLNNISSPNRLKPDYFEMVIVQVLRRNSDTDMVLVDHDNKSFNIRIKARFKALGLENRL